MGSYFVLHSAAYILRIFSCELALFLFGSPGLGAAYNADVAVLKARFLLWLRIFNNFSLIDEAVCPRVYPTILLLLL